MEKKESTSMIFLSLLMGFAGITAIVLSLFPMQLDSSSVKGIRAIGFSLLFISIGEWLNHPLQKSFTALDETSDTSLTLIHRRRNPCGLGNVFDVFGLILIFIALSLFFFPYG
jgi:hypothetical protein